MGGQFVTPVSEAASLAVIKSYYNSVDSLMAYEQVRHNWHHLREAAEVVPFAQKLLLEKG